MTRRFERTDVVTLLSGGLKMTVNSVNGEQIGCIWMDAQGHIQTASIHFHLLVRVSE